MTNRKQILAAIGLLIVLAILGNLMNRQLPPRIDLPFDTRSTIVAAEFMKAPEEVNAVFGAGHRYAAEIKKQQYLDFAFIPFYVALFALLGLSLRGYDVPGARIMAWTAAGLAVAAGVLDVFENLSILSVAANPNAFSANVRPFSVPKWLLVFAVVTIESAALFFWPGLKFAWRLFAVVVGALFLFAGTSGFLFAALVSVPDIEFSARWMSYALIGLLLFLIAILLHKPGKRA